MQNVCPNPGCGATYNLGSQHLGRRLTCRQCASTLMVTAAGLQFADAEPAHAPLSAIPQPTPMYTPSPTPAPLAVESTPRFSRGMPMNQLKDQLFTLLFGAGTVLILVFLFLPLIDLASSARQAAKSEIGDLRINRAEADLTERKVSRTSDEWKRFDDDKKAWDKEKPGLLLDAEEARIDMRKSRYWHTWGMLVGFLLLSVASIGYLNPNEAKVRRVVGAIVICSILLLVFLAFVIQSAVGR